MGTFPVRAAGRETLVRVKHSEFARAAADVLGEAGASSYLSDLTLAGVGYRTANEALAEGFRHQEVWDALVDELGLPASTRWHHRRSLEE